MRAICGLLVACAAAGIGALALLVGVRPAGPEGPAYHSPGPLKGAEEGRPERSDAPDTRPLNDAIRHAMKAWGAPGVAVVVVRDDRVIYLEGHGVREAGKKAPVTADTVFALSSNSKAFTSALIASLADEGA